MYCEFRPDVSGWGKRGEVKCSTILGLKKVVDKTEKGGGEEEIRGTDKIVKLQSMDDEDKVAEAEEPDRKKARGMTLEEYETALDADDTFNDLDLSIGDLLEGTSTNNNRKPH